MSIKNYDGFILPQTTLEQALDKIAILRRQVRKEALRQITQMVARKAAYQQDRWLARELYGPEKIDDPDGAISKVWNDIQDRGRAIQRENRRDPEVDFSFEMALLPVRGDVLGIPFTEMTQWVKMWMGTDGVHDFGYWDNTDQPEDMSREAWVARGNLWEEAMASDPSGRPGYAGFTAHIHEVSPPWPDFHDIIAAIPPVEKRAEVVAKAVIRGDALREGTKGENVPMSQISNILFSTHEFLQTEEGQEKLAETANRVRSFIPDILTADILRGA